jgi:hypothetical protein
MIKTNKNIGSIFSAIDDVYQKGGISNKQGSTYVKVFEKIGSPLNSEVMRLIEQNKSSKDILHIIQKSVNKKTDEPVFD